MKKIVLIVIVLLVVGGGIFWIKRHGSEPAPAGNAADKAADDESAGTKISRDDKGNVILTMNDETQGNAGINVTKAEPAQYDPEIKSYGRVLDPAPLAAMLADLATAQAAYETSSNELVRLKTLEGQGNASKRALQTAAALALRDQLTFQSAKDRLALGWGKAVEREDLPGFLKSLTSLDQVLIRLDLPAGESSKSSPVGARIISLSGNVTTAEFVSAAANVDPQTQGRGFIFLAANKASALTPGEAVTGFIKVKGEPLNGVVISNAAVVRTEGSPWVYVLQGNAEDFVRVAITLDRPLESGWFVTNGVTTSNYVVTTGAQMLLSEELKGNIKPD